MSDFVPTEQVAPTGILRVVINLGNPVLAQGTPDEPRGVTVAIARELARWLGVPLQLECVDAARKAYAAITEGRVDLCFLANEPSREEGVAFTAPYVVIEGVYVVGADAAFETSRRHRPGRCADRRTGRVGLRPLPEPHPRARRDRAGPTRRRTSTRIGAGGRCRSPPADGRVRRRRSGLRILEPPFMEINQAVGLPRAVDPGALAAVAAFVEELKASGFVADALTRSGVEASVAPPA